jgi:hypothetical protein
MTMTSTTGDTSPLVGTLRTCPNCVRRIYTRMIAARQKRADVHNAMYLRGRRLAVRIAQYVRFYADCYSAAVQYEDLANLSAAELERRGIAPGDLHRHVADALPKWPGAK